MKHRNAARLSAAFCLTAVWASAGARSPGALTPLPREYVPSGGLRRTVRFYRPEQLARRPALVIALHGSGGDGERFRSLTGGAFERLADEHGFLLAYPDAIGGQWKDCRARTPYRQALTGIDDVGFLRAVTAEAKSRVGQKLGRVFLVGYSNGGHLAFRAALEAPRAFTAFAAIGAHLPVPEEWGCHASDVPVSMLLVSGTEDPINPFAGGQVRPPGGDPLGRVVSAEDTARYFRIRIAAPAEPLLERHPDRDPEDGTRVETFRWIGKAHEVALMVVHGGGHALPHPDAHFPEKLVGRTSRDLDGAAAVWSFFHRQMDVRTSDDTLVPGHSRGPASGRPPGREVLALTRK